jgi:hypothetical protein
MVQNLSMTSLHSLISQRPGSPFLQECTSNVEDYTGPPAWSFKISSEMSPPSHCPPEPRLRRGGLLQRGSRKEVVPSSLDQEASNIHKVWIHFLNSSFLMTLLNRPTFFVGQHWECPQQGRANTSGKPELGHPRESCGDGWCSGQSLRPTRADCYNVGYQSFPGEGISYS